MSPRDSKFSSIKARRRAVLAAVSSAAVLALFATPAVSSASGSAPTVQPQTAAPASALTVIRVVLVGSPFSSGIAVDSLDDTVYVSNTNSNTVYVIDGATGAVASTVSVGVQPTAIAVDQADDTVYVTNFASDSLSVLSGRNTDDSFVVPVGDGPLGLAVDEADDTVYVANSGSENVSIISGRTTDDSFIKTDTTGCPYSCALYVATNESDDTVYVTGTRTLIFNGRTRQTDTTIPQGNVQFGVAVNQGDDTVYVANYDSDTVWVINGRNVSERSLLSVGNGPRGVAIDEADDTVYVTNALSNTISVIRASTATVDDTLTMASGSQANGIAVDNAGANAGLVYVTDGALSIIGVASPTLTTMSGAAGDSATISVDVPQVSYDVDDLAVDSVAFDDTVATGLTAGPGDTWSVTVPEGSGTVPVTVIFRGGLTATAGSFTYAAAPPPPPGPTPTNPIPPSAPGNVAAVASDGSATVTWTPPTSPGSYPVSTYQVISAPSGKACLTSALTCTVTGLSNGTAYTFTVKALSGAGWGASSLPSNGVTPEAPPTPSITIVGTRDGKRITVTGTSMRLAGQSVRPWIRLAGQSAFAEGAAAIPVGFDGAFTWSRRAAKTVSVYVSDGSTTSNIVAIARRGSAK